MPARHGGRVVVTGLDDGCAGLFADIFASDATTRLVWHDGYYETGDVAWRDEDGFYWFVGRSDDVIKCSGYRIDRSKSKVRCKHTAPYLNAQSQRHRMRFAVRWSRRQSYWLRAMSRPKTLKHELQAHVKHVTAPYKYPRIIEFVTELPKTISGKIRRVEIRGNDEKK